MSEKTELVAAAQINAFGPEPAGIEFTANTGFETATRASAGSYDLELEHEHGISKLVVSVTRNNTLPGTIEASLPSKKHIQISAFDADGAPADSPFFITVLRVRD